MNSSTATLDDQTQDSLRTHPGVARVRDVLAGAGLADTIVVMPEAAHTAAAAAAVLSCDVAEIAKSIVFRAGDGRAVLVVTSGANRVDDRKVAALIGQAVGKADAAFVRTQTGFAIGGVSPLAHLNPPIALMDRDLLRFARVWPAAGHPNTMFGIAPGDLLRVTGAQAADVALEKSA